jgi:AcrR family transcriptional regulator
MNNNPRMSCDERKEKILAAVRKIFSRKGVEGVTTRELAKEAGVSEALLYKHYPSKEALYRAMLLSCTAEFHAELDRIAALEPSTSTLIHLVHFHISNKILKASSPEMDAALRFYVRSLTEDGSFARIAHEERIPKYLHLMEECLKAAQAAGDIAETSVSPEMRAILAERLGFMIMLNYLPSKPVIDFESKEQAIEDTVRFILRGIGIKDDVIKRQYNPKALALAS